MRFSRLFAAAFVFAALLAQAKGGYHRLRTEFRLVIRMQAHAVPMITILIGKHAIKTGSNEFLNTFAQSGQSRRPCQWLMRNTRIPIGQAGICVPGQ